MEPWEADASPLPGPQHCPPLPQRQLTRARPGLWGGLPVSWSTCWAPISPWVRARLSLPGVAN